MANGSNFVELSDVQPEKVHEIKIRPISENHHRIRGYLGQASLEEGITFERMFAAAVWAKDEPFDLTTADGREASARARAKRRGDLLVWLLPSLASEPREKVDGVSDAIFWKIIGIYRSDPFEESAPAGTTTETPSTGA